MAEEVINELEHAFKQLKDEAASLVKDSKTEEFRETNGRLNDEFMARYFLMRSNQLRVYEQLISELRSNQEPEAKTYLEEEAMFFMIPAVNALLGKLNFVINGNIPPSGTATPRQASPQRALLDETIEVNTSNNNQVPHPEPSASSMFPEENVLKYLRKPDIELEKFSGDPMKYHKFIRRFKMKIIPACADEDERLTYLEQFTSGDAHRVVVGYSHMESGGLDAAMNELQRRFGQPPTIRISYVDKIKNFPAFTVKEPKKLDELGTLLLEYLHATKQASNTLNDLVEIRKIVSKLPIPSRNRWRSLVASVRARGDEVGFTHVVDFVNAEAMSANDPIFGVDALSGPADNNVSSTGRKFRSGKHRTNVAVASSTDRKVSERKVFKKFCKHCSGEHWLQDCETFAKLSHEEKKA